MVYLMKFGDESAFEGEELEKAEDSNKGGSSHSL